MRSTAEKEAPKASTKGHAAAAPAVFFEGDYPVEKIDVIRNIRKNFDEKKMKELSDNIREAGVLEPLILQHRGNDSHPALIAGERRLRAAKTAGLKTVPVRILEVTDKLAAEMQLFENLHRQDLSPIEQARAFKALKDEAEWTVEEVAAKVDKSVVYVYQTLRLLELPAVVVTAIDKGELTQAHGLQLLRAPETEQERLAKWALKEKATAKELGVQIDQHLGADLTRAKFPKDVPYAGKPACSACPLNSGNQKDLLGQVVAGRCTGPACFKAKQEQSVKDQAEEMVKKFPGCEFLGVTTNRMETKKPVGAVQVYDWQLDKVKKFMKDSPGEFQIAVIQRPYSDKPEIEVYTKMPAAIKALRSKYASSGPKGESPRQRFIRKQIERGVMEVVAKLGERGLNKKQMMLIAEEISDSRQSHARAIYGIKDEEFRYNGDPQKALARLDEKQLCGFILVCAVGGYMGEPNPDNMKHLGLSLTELKVKAKKDAEEAWENRKAQKLEAAE